MADIKVVPVARTQASWGAVLALGLGIFSIAMSQFLPASLLPLMAGDLGVSLGAAGQSMTATAVAAALSAVLISVLLPRADRRWVMIGLTCLTVVSDLVVALAPNLPVLLVARFLLGVALGGFWAMAIAVTAHLVPAGQLGRALTVVNAGVPIATAVAVPLGAWLGEVWGWRAVFALGAGAAALALVVQAVSLPRVPAGATSGLRALGSTLQSRLVLLGLVATVLVYGGHFAGFTYIRPLTANLSGTGAAGLAVLLLVFGVANLAGTLVAGPLADRSPRLGVSLFPATVGVGMLLMLVAGSSTPGLFAAAMVWGLGFGGVATSLQSWGARAEPSRLEQIGGLLVMVANVAVAVGAVVGGVILDSAPGTATPLVGGLASIAGAAVLTSLRPRLSPGSLRGPGRGPGSTR